MANQSIYTAFETMWQHIVAKVGTKADLNHNHDDLYYTEVEMDTALNNKADKNHTHDEYETKADASIKYDEQKSYTDSALNAAKSYADTKVVNMATTTVVDNKIGTHDTSTSAHNDIRVLISDLTTEVNNFLDVDDTTRDQLSEVLTLIDNNKGTLDSLTTTKVNVSDIIDNLTTASANKVLSANQGVAIKQLIDSLELVVNGKAASVHTHAISDITGLENALETIADNVSGKSSVQLFIWEEND